MKKIQQFLLFIFLLGFIFSLSPASVYSTDTYPVVDYLKVDKGVSNLRAMKPFPPYDTLKIPFAGTLMCKIDSDTGLFYCVDLRHNIYQNPTEMIDTGNVKAHILYIILNYFPQKPYPYPNALSTVQKEAAAIQLAIWFFSDSLDINTIEGNSDLKTRALQIITDAGTNWATANFVKTVKLIPVAIVGSAFIADTLRVQVTNWDGVPMSGITVNLSSTAGLLSSTSVVTGTNGLSPIFTIQKNGPDSVATLKACTYAPIGPGNLYIHKTSPNTYQKLAIASRTYGNKCDRVCLTWGTSGGGGGGVESNYNMAEMLFLRNILLRKGEASSMLKNDHVMTPTYPLQTFIPQIGPFNSTPIETTPFDIFSISNATSAYAVDYMLNNSRVAVIFSTTTNPPEVYTHTKSICDRLAYYSMEDLSLFDINGKQFYGAKLMKPKMGWTDASVSFTVYQTPSGFVIDDKWTNEEYQSPQNAINVYNIQVWSPDINTTRQLVQQVIAKFQNVMPVTYLNNSLTEPDVYLKKATYTNDGNIRLLFENKFNQYKSVNLNIYYKRQQGVPEQQITISTVIEPYGNELIIPIGYISDSRIYMTSNTGFIDAVFVAGGVYGPYAGPQSTITEFTNIVTQNPPQYPEGTLVYPGGARIQGVLNDELMIGRSTDASFEGVDLSAFDKLGFEAKGTGKLDVYLEVKMNNEYYYPYIQINLEQDIKLYEIPFRTFKINNVPVDMKDVSMLGFTMKKYANQNISNVDFSVGNVAFYNNNEYAMTVIPSNYELYQNYPNPFNPVTYIKVDIPKESKVTIKLFDVLGREVKTIFNSVLKPVSGYEIPFDASGLSTGIYFYRLSVDGVNITKKMVYQK